MTFNSIQLNFAPGNHVRFETFDGREYLVAPVVMLTVGVHNGSNGPILYTRDELSKTPEAWNMKPLVVYHPTRNGVGISACTPEVIQTQGVGLIMNARFDGKLRAEAWFDLEKTRRVDDRIVEALEEGKMMEVSTGLFTDNEKTEGVFNGAGEEEKYVAIARNFRPDHLAILPDQIGACSIKDGAGLLQTNALSHSDLHSQLHSLIRSKYGPDAWVVDVFDRWFVFSYEGKLWRLMFTKRNDLASISDNEKEPVIPQTVYRTVEGKLVANSYPTSTSVVVRHDFSVTSNTEKEPMDNQQLIDQLIDNEQTAWTKDHQEFLSNQDADFLKSLLPADKPQGEQTHNNEPKETAPTANQNTQPQQTQNTQPQQPARPQTVEEYISNAPGPMRDTLQEMLQNSQEKRQRCIEQITANESNTLTKETLEAMPMAQLSAIAALAAQPRHNDNAPQHTPNYMGATGVAPTGNASATDSYDEEPLDLPSVF